MKKVNRVQVSLAFILCALATWYGCKAIGAEEAGPGQAMHSTVISSGKVKKVLFIGIDGLVWRTITTTNAPVLKALMDNSWTSTNALAEIPTWSSNGWSALLTGTGVAKHKATDNSFSNADFKNYPSFFHEVKAGLPNARTGSFVTWAPINDKIIAQGDATFRNSTGSDDATEKGLIKEISTNNPDVLFIQFDDVDHAGHAENFKPTTPSYVAAVKVVDQRVKRVLDALKARSTYKDEDWLVVVAADHGGDISHGGPSYLEQNSFIILNNMSVTPKIVEGEPVSVIETKPNTVTALNFQKDIYGEFPALPDLDLSSSGSLTFEFNVRATSTVSDPVILGNKNWANGANKGIIISNNKGKIRANFGEGTSNRLDVDGVDLTDQNWHHVTIVLNRSTKKVTLYDGGVQVSEGDISKVGDLQSGSTFKIGQDGTGKYGQVFNGNIAGLRVFKTALGANTISTYAFKDIDDSHPDFKALVLNAKGNDGSGVIYAGSLGSSDISIRRNNGADAVWSNTNAAIFVKKTIDYKNAPHLYDVAATILKFLGIDAPANYDGHSLINF
ncbi:alkaline phosphatase family protein [Pedobacter sp. PAMC26386]|nr:alkaline phosphatase family protein [Pedobacter sp. PAMC26386]